MTLGEILEQLRDIADEARGGDIRPSWTAKRIDEVVESLEEIVAGVADAIVEAAAERDPCGVCGGSCVDVCETVPD